jgi:hypothetical protein
VLRDNQLNRAASPAKKILQSIYGIFCKAKVVKINIQYRVHWLCLFAERGGG